MKITYRKTISGLVPNDPESEIKYNKIKLGAVVENESKAVRNPAFLRKFFALLNFAYEYWTPLEINDKYGIVEKGFEQFREDVTILAGYYIRTIRLDGSVRVSAKSISFAKMDDDEFSKLYNAVINVILNKIFTGMEEEELNELVNKTLEFC